MPDPNQPGIEAVNAALTNPAAEAEAQREQERQLHQDKLAGLSRENAELSKQTRPESEFLMQFFVYGHLPPHLQEISRPFSDLADRIVKTLPRNPERTVALRKILEAKDCAVRCALAQPTGGPQ